MLRFLLCASCSATDKRTHRNRALLIHHTAEQEQTVTAQTFEAISELPQATGQR